jgi:hypothetical protein
MPQVDAWLFHNPGRALAAVGFKQKGPKVGMGSGSNTDKGSGCVLLSGG